MQLIDRKGKEKGLKAELKFKEWLEKHKISYLYIDQDKEAFSSVFRDSIKRPDFMILLPNLGFIMVEVKNKELHKIYKSFALDSIETRKFSELQRKFNLPTWYALSNEALDFKTWYWIPISKVLEEGKNPEFKSSKSAMDFFPVPINEFIQIANDDQLSRLFSKSF